MIKLIGLIDGALLTYLEGTVGGTTHNLGLGPGGGASRSVATEQRRQGPGLRHLLRPPVAMRMRLHVVVHVMVLRCTSCSPVTVATYHSRHGVVRAQRDLRSAAAQLLSVHPPADLGELRSRRRLAHKPMRFALLILVLAAKRLLGHR